MEIILNEAIDNPSVQWLDPVTSFQLENTLDSHLDFPITLKAFLFSSFNKVEKDPDSDHYANILLISFYLKNVKPLYEICSFMKITAVKVFGLIETESFLNVRFKTARGVLSLVFEFMLAELPCLNPFDWISLFHLLLKDE
ncbi:unnamed protein product [Lactuca saligna]|uniref:Uncharacterized protein n=1 Tax=Lactuca saligna TaxID=75948 RepID=A0AA35ZVU2_LACSI|nr:unnamed protein product [Lactuca saligna]